VKELLDSVKETWEIVQTGPENEILRDYAEKSRIFTKQYISKLFFIINNLMTIHVYNIHTLISATKIYIYSNINIINKY